MTAQETFDELMSSLDYPMFIVTTAAAEEISGCLVGFVSQASIDPPRLLVMLSKRNHTYAVARHAEVLAVHVLGTDNHDLATLFGEQTGDTTDKFADCEWSGGPGGVPVLTGTRGWIAGRILQRIDAGDHVAHLLDVIKVEKGSSVALLTFQTVRDMEPGHDN